ncbi:hypothetical protein, partial [uncultured Brevundimonas sp.]|uniref:hypothetical protein n=1 Tax=uncultured Brevundimonas sp. TaxID=213418 RepID=UPI00261C9FBD
VVPRGQGAGIAISMVAAFFIFRHRFPDEWGGEIGLFLVLCVIVLSTTWSRASAKLAPEIIKEKPPEV